MKSWKILIQTAILPGHPNASVESGINFCLTRQDARELDEKGVWQVQSGSKNSHGRGRAAL